MSETRRESAQRRRTYCPAVDIYQTETEVVLVADLPGVTREDLSVEVEQNVLTISGRVRSRESLGEERLREFEDGDFYRAFTLTDEADPDGIEATFSAGVLTLRIPRRRAPEGRRIEVKVE